MASFTEEEIQAVMDYHHPTTYVVDEGDGYTWVETECEGCGQWSGWSLTHVLDALRDTKKA